MTRFDAVEQVMLTYGRRLVSSKRMVLMFAAFLFPGVMFAIGNHKTPSPALYYGPLMLLGMLIVHTREQFTDSRARTTPGFRSAHALVACSLMAVVLIGTPAVVMIVFGRWLSDVVLLIWILGVATVWGILKNSFLALGIGLLLWFAMISSWGEAQAEWVRAHPFHPAVLLAFVVSVVLLIAGVWRLTTLNEEMPEYHRVSRASGWDLRNRRTYQNVGSQSGVLTRGVSHNYDRRIAQLIKAPPDTFWTRVSRWQIVCNTFPPLLFGGLIGLVSGLFSLWSYGGLMSGLTRIDHGNFRLSIAIAMLMLQMTLSSMMPFVFWTGQIMQRWRFIDREFLFPVNKDALFKEIGGAYAVNLVLMLAGTMAGFLLPLAIVGPAFFGTFIERLVVEWSMIVAALVLWFGVIAWVGRYRSQGLIMFVAVVCTPLIFTSSAMLTMVRANTTTLLLFDAAVVIAGLAVTRDAYRRWLNTELG